MIIGIDASFFRKPFTGMGQVTVNFIKELSNQSGTENKYILYLEEDINLQLPSNFEKRMFLPPYKRDDLIRKIWWEKYLLPKKIKEDGCEIFLSMYQSTTELDETVKHIMIVHDTVWKIFPQYLNNLRKKIYYGLVDAAIMQVDQIVTVSENSKKDIEKFYNIPTDRILVNYDDCDPIFKKEISQNEVAVVKKKYCLPNDYIFYIGGLDVRKNVDRIIEAYGFLLKESTNVPDLVLVGKFHPHLVPLITDVPKKIQQALEFSGAGDDKIKRIDFVPSEDLPALYKGAKLFCYPSLYEGFGIPVVEAYNTETLTVTSNASSLKELADDTTAIIVDPTDTNAIADAMKVALKDGQLKESLVFNAKQRATQYSWEKFTQNITENFKN